MTMIASKAKTNEAGVPEPPFRLGRSLSNDFMECRLQGVDPAFKHVDGHRTADGDYVAQPIGAPEPIPETGHIRARKEEFLNAFKAYGDSVKNDPGLVMDPRSRYSWKQVLSQLERAEKVYQKNQKGSLVSLEKCGANFSKYEKSVQSWMQLLPTESWQGSLVCGAFKIIFGAIAKVGKVRKDVGEVLEQIPVTIDKVYDLIGVYQSKLTRQEHLTQFFLVLLKLLQHCVEWFTAKGYQKLLGSLSRGDSYGEDLRETFTDFKRLEKRIDDGAAVSMHRTVDVVDKKLNALLTAKNALLANTYKLLSDQESRENVVNYVRAYIEEERAAKAKEERREQAVMRARRRYLQRNLSYDQFKCLEDLTRCLTMNPVSFPRARDRTDWILTSCPEVAEWTFGETSSLLIINANEEIHGGGESAVSMFSAALAHSIDETESSEKTVVLSWFSGQNLHSSPLDMASALLGQLLDKGTASLASAARMEEIEKLDLEELRDVVGLLQAWLRAQLAKTTVYCICDSVSSYEDYRRRKGLVNVYEMLWKVVDNGGEEEGGFPLKVLMTSPTHCTILGTDFDKRRPRVVTVPEAI